MGIWNHLCLCAQVLDVFRVKGADGKKVRDLHQQFVPTANNNSNRSNQERAGLGVLISN
jgi:hypothetical protein